MEIPPFASGAPTIHTEGQTEFMANYAGQGVGLILGRGPLCLDRPVFLSGGGKGEGGARTSVSKCPVGLFKRLSGPSTRYLRTGLWASAVEVSERAAGPGNYAVIDNPPNWNCNASHAPSNPVGAAKLALYKGDRP